jgi:peptidoglycan/LPS O-acetylase OafA/YrhL
MRDGCVLLALSGLVWFLSSALEGRWTYLAPLLSAVVVLAVALAPGSSLARILQFRPFLWLGKVSYSIYMVHMAVVFVATQLLVVAVKVPRFPGAGEMRLRIGPVAGLAALLAYVGTVLLVSHLTYTWIEAPFRSASRRLARLWFARNASLKSERYSRNPEPRRRLN